jgi:carboxyl-terminal processing protease
MKTYHKQVSAALLLVLIVGVAYYSGISVGKRTVEASVASSELVTVLNKDLAKPDGVDFGPFWKVWDVLNSKYVPTTSTTSATSTATVTDQKKVYGAIQGLADSLGDPYTVFLPPTENAIFQADVKGNFEGVGMEIGLKDGVITVIAPLKDSPSARAGMKAGDKILKIDTKSTQNFSTEESVFLIRGKKGTTVVFNIFREGVTEPFDISVVRDVINIPTIDTELRSDGVFVISLYSFSESSPELFRKALREFIETRSDKLVLDLRGNPGGYLEAAIDMASWFLPPSKIVVKEDFGTKQTPQVYKSSGYDIFNSNLKFVILIDAGSASASEILSGALSENGIAKLVGQKSFGKGSVQELVPITADTSLKVTIARWLTPNGTSISKYGIKPDIEVVNTEESLKNGEDLQMNKAVETLLNWKK